MSAPAIIARAQAASVSLWAEGDKLRWRAPAPPPPDLEEMLALIRAHKGDVLRALRGGGFEATGVPDGAVTPVPDVTRPAYERETDVAWWRDYFEERAGIREFDAGMNRAEAEVAALKDLASRWRALHSLPARDRQQGCAHCGRSVDLDDGVPVLAAGGHSWLHARCWGLMDAARQREAEATVRAMLKANR